MAALHPRQLWVTTIDSVLQIDPRRAKLLGHYELEERRRKRRRDPTGSCGSPTRSDLWCTAWTRSTATSSTRSPPGPGPTPSPGRALRCGSRASPARTSAASADSLAASATARQNAARGDRRGRDRPVRLVVRDDLERSRLTVFFRLILAIPLFIWVVLRGIAAFLVGFVNWLAVLIQAEVPDSLHDFVANYIRYSTQVGAYVFLAANPYPWFRVQQDYPVDVEIDPPVRQGRWGGFFRLLLAVPTLVLATALGGGLATGSSGQSSAASSNGGEGALVQRVVGGRRRSSRCLPRVVRDPRARKRPARAARRDGSHWAMPRTGRRVSLPAHTALPDVRPEARRALRGRRSTLCGSSWTTTSHDRG